jgi:hypothetical protein
MSEKEIEMNTEGLFGWAARGKGVLHRIVEGHIVPMSAGRIAGGRTACGIVKNTMQNTMRSCGPEMYFAADMKNACARCAKLETDPNETTPDEADEEAREDGADEINQGDDLYEYGVHVDGECLVCGNGSDSCECS